MPFEEIPVLTDTKQVTLTQPQPIGVSIETQTGPSLSSPSISQQLPINVEVQTFDETPTERETIKISKTVIGNQETIQIATKPTHTVDGEGDLLVEADYRTKPDMAEKPEEKTTELHIFHTKSDKPFETVMVEPDETTTEVIVDADGTKRIIVKKLQRTVVSRQQMMQQQHLTTLSTLSEGDVPVSQSFSQVTLQGQQSSTTIARGDGRKETLTSQNYGGKIMSGVPGGDIDVQEFQSEPEHHYTIVHGTEPGEVELQGIKLHEGDVTLVDNHLLPIDPNLIQQQGEEIHTSSSTVRAVVQQVTRKIIRKTRRIIRRIVIVDGKEQVTEEIVEEPEEVEVTEEGIPRVSINVTRTQDGVIVQEPMQTEPVVLEPDEENVTVDDGERYVFEQATIQKSPIVQSPSSVISEFIEKERSAPSVLSTRIIDQAPSVDAAPAVTREDKQPSPQLTQEASTSISSSLREPSPVEEISSPQKLETVTADVITALPGLVKVEHATSSPVTHVEVIVTATKSGSPTPVTEDDTKLVKPETPIETQAIDSLRQRQQVEPEIAMKATESLVTKPKLDVNSQFIITEQQSLYQQVPNMDEITLHLTETRIEAPEPDLKYEVSEPTSREIHFMLAVEEKQSDPQIPSPKVTVAMQLEDSEGGPVQKDVYVNLPTQQTTTFIQKVDDGPEEISLNSEIDHGGTKTKKKKKHKDLSKSITPEEEARPPTDVSEEKPLSVETSLAESTEIIIPDDSQASPDTPKYTEEFFDAATPDDENISEGITGYEPEDKTTVEEHLDDSEDKKKKRKKRKKQKERVNESEESAIPKSIDESSPFGESVQFSDEEGVKYVKPDEPKKEKKRKRKQKKSETELEPESDPAIVEAYSDELHSLNDSYKTMATPSEADSVKVIQEGYPTPPDSESVDSITSKIVTTVPVIEAVITQEVTMQTSPEVSEIVEDVKVKSSVEEIRPAVQVEQVSIQTTPEIPIETSEISLQTIELAEEVKPETTEMSSQVEITTSEFVTQTSTPEDVSPKLRTPTAIDVMTMETSMQTQSPPALVEETVQTITPEQVEPIRSDSQMQTTAVLSQEQYVQTITPDATQVQIKETSEFSSQIHPYDISEPLEEYAQTSPTPSAPPLDEITQTSTPDQPSPPHHFEPLPTRIETVETTSQTPPVVIKQPGETTPSSSLEGPYEVHVQAFVTLPSDADSLTPQKSELTPTLTMEDISSDSDMDIEVTVDGKSVQPKVVDFLESERAYSSQKRRGKKHKTKPKSAENKDLFAQFKRAEDTDLLDPNDLYSEVVKRGSRSSSPVPGEDEAEQIITSKVITDLDLAKLKSMEKPRVEQPETFVQVSFTIPGESSPEEKQIVTPVTTIEIQPSEVLVTELSIDTGNVPTSLPTKEKKPIKQKGKSKHKSSVTIEEVLSPTEIADTPLSPSTDVISEEMTRVWTAPAPVSKPKSSSADLISAERQAQIPSQINWNQIQTLERVKNLQNVQKSTHLSEVLFLASLNEPITEETIEEKNYAVQQNVNALKSAIHRGDVMVIQHTIVTTVETITTWLHTIEYRIYMQRQQTSDGPSREKVEEFSNLKEEIATIENNVKELHAALADTRDIYNEDERNRMKNYVESLESQLRVIEEITQQNEKIVADDFARWQQFINGLENISQLVNDIKKQLNSLIESDASPQTKLQELEELETLNRSHMLKTVHLISAARGLMRDFPNREIPLEVYTMHDVTKQIDHHIAIQREKSLHLLALAEEYVQTLKEFAHIIEIADALVDSPIAVRSLEHLEEEVQNHRKFFINLSHCRAILESLEENLDSETRALHSKLHQKLYQRASGILDKAAGRLQQMSLAASRWTVLEQGMKEEQRWLEVARGRVPDLSNVTSVDYDQYINLYQSLSLDISHHHTKLSHFNNNAQRLQELITCTNLEETYSRPLEIIIELYEDVSSKLKRLLLFRDSWTSYNYQTDKLEYWLKAAQQDLDSIDMQPSTNTPTPGHMKQFWELKAQHEVYNNTRMESANALEKSMQILPVADEMLQRKFHTELQDHWRNVSRQINDIQTAITENISAPDVPVNEKLLMLEQELEELKSIIEGLGGVIKSEEELNLYVERLQIMQGRVETIQNELGRLGLLSADECEKVGSLLALSKSVEIQVAEELEGSTVLRDRLQAIQRGLGRVRRNHSRLEQTLNQCESCEKLGSDVVEKAVVDCREVGEELVTLWQDLMGLRQLLHTLPMRLRVTVSPTKVERGISQLQDEHTALEKRCGQLLALLRSRLALWQRFEKQLELVQQSVQEADFMMDLFTVQGQVDYERILKATERLEGLSGDLVNRETLLAELRSCAEPLASSCTPEVSAHVEAAVTEAVTAWEDTCTNLRELCTRYQTAADLWKQYRDASELIREWCDTQMESVNGLEPEEAVKTVKVCQDTLAAHTSRLAELRNLVSEIAAAVGLDGNALLGGEVEALGHRLQDVRESLTILADVAEGQANSTNQIQEEFVKAKDYLTSVQMSVIGIDAVPDNQVEKKLETLRDHLLELSKTESRIQKMKDSSLEKSRPRRTESSIIEILQLWQQVFRETFQQYHRLSTRLIKNEDSMAALKLWQEYLLHVQQFLLGSIPSEYNSLAEHQRLLEVHQNLLTTQQSILQPLSNRDSKLYELNLLEQFNTLTNLHNETLSKIIDRHGEVSNRLSAWDRYRYDQNRLLGWLKDMEKERERLQLRYINIRRVPKVLAKIQTLLSQIPQGEEQSEQLQKQQPQLLQFSDDAFGASIRMEHVAIVQRISNLQAGLDTWKQFLERIGALVKVYEEKVKKIQDLFDSFQDTINSNSQELPGTHSVIAYRLETLRQIRGKLNDLTKDLEQLGVTQEQLKECVSPMDMKTISQRMWLLWHQQGDIDHQLTILCHQLEERLGLRSAFEARQSRFIIWADNLEKRLEEEQEKGDPSEVLRRLETDLQTEMSLKNHEYKWLTYTGKELVSACGEDYSDVVAKQNLQVKTDEVRKRWERLEQLGKNRISKIQDMTQTMLQLELRIAEIKSWLHQTEIKLSKPIVFESSNKDVIDKLIQEHDVLKKSIEKESVIIGEVINLWELLLSDADVWKIYFTTESITLDIQNIEKRWKIVCGKAVERKQKLVFVWKLLLEILRVCSEQEQWLTAQDDALKQLDKPVNKQSREQISEKITKLENLIKEVESRSPTFEILEQTYSKLAKTSGLDPMNVRKLTSHVRQSIIKWRDILPNAQGVLQNLQRELALYKEFVAAHGNAIMGLTRIDAQLTELQHLISPEIESPVIERLEKLEKIDQSLTAQNTILENADKLGLLLMQRRPKPESTKIQEMIDEYQLLWKDIQERIITLKSNLKMQRREMDEGVQVETLKFEQDTAVQVNTLPPHLQRMMSITPKDAYMVELASAIGESTSNVNKLQSIVDKDIPQQGSTELHIIAKQIAKLLVTCQSSIELMNHLHDVLIDECDATEDEARSEEVKALSTRYSNLISKAKQKETKIRELRSSISDAYSFLCEHEAGRLLCPLCTKRNWAQLDNDLWRLEQWLQAAEGIQSSQRSPPSNIELLEDVIQDHREFLLDLDSHKSIIRSLNIVGTHLADHAEDTERADKLRERLDDDNKRWDGVCLSAATWQTTLQKALMDNRQFHLIVEELCAWLEKTENQIKASEPVDLTVDTESINNKFERFCLLKSELEHCEPRVMSLQENANQLLRHEQAPEGSITICTRLNELRLKLHSLIRLTRIYVLKLGAVLGRDPNELGLDFVSSSITAGPSLHSLSYNLLDQATATQGAPAAQDNSTYTGNTDDLKINTTVLRRGYHFLGRVIRASLPIQAIMLLLLGVASLVPYTEDDYACSLVNTFANSFNPTLRYPDGPPPI
ncbi:hypothetical protein RI129_006856 [Pyrocoelia pectoralis]|uniref:KASH domain-containing protein n=1 Tax=Pyrocoelia pectoralis TaxID=417401 RepID=A0AAN7VHT0_9COLE